MQSISKLKALRNTTLAAAALAALSLPAAHAATTTSGSARVCAMSGAGMPLNCVSDVDQASSDISVAGSIADAGTTGTWTSDGGGPYSGRASYAGSLATGTIRALAQASERGRADASVQLKDTLTFTGLAAGNNNIHFELALTGFAAWDRAPGLTLPGGSGVGNAAIQVTRGVSVLQKSSATFKVYDPAIDRTLTLDFAVTPQAPSFDFVMSLFASIDVYQLNLGKPVGSGLLDLSHTAQLSMSMPEGVNMQSSSGVFLTQAVPEPATWAMLFAGLGIVGAAARRRKLVHHAGPTASA